MNSPIVLATANALFSHSSLGLRSILANLGELREKTLIIEHTIKDSPEEIVKKWLSYHPKIIGVGIYIWNLEVLNKAISLIKKTNPEITIIIGGPEVSYGVTEDLFNQVDFIIELEGEDIFKDICSSILDGNYPTQKKFKAPLLNTKNLLMPYEHYTNSDIKNRKIYVEASRGCPFQCQFCLSALGTGIRKFDTDLFLEEIRKLYQRGARQFKFVDRTFNLDIKLSIKILTFFLEQFKDQDFFLHFEVVPDRLPQELKKYITQFQPGKIQFEVGIQTFDKEISERIGRRQDKLKAIKNLTYLRFETNAHLHVDLIIGLPGGTLDIFKNDLNQLISIGLQEVQIGMLKLLKGAPINQHIEPFQLIFQKTPPYEIQSTIDIDLKLMNQLRNFQRFWDKFYNSGNFNNTLNFLFTLSNPFDEFYQLSEYAFNRLNKTFSIPLDDLAEALHLFLTKEKKISYEQSRELILTDLLAREGQKVPIFLKDFKLGVPNVKVHKSHSSLKRQRR